MALAAGFPPQHQDKQPGLESDMDPQPVYAREKKTNRLDGKKAIITGGDSGIGRAVAIAFAQEGADSLIVYLNEHTDAHETQQLVQDYGGKCYTMAGDLGDPKFCEQVAKKAKELFGQVDVLVNNAAEQHAVKEPEQIPNDQIEKTFRTNMFSMFYLTKAVLPLMPKGSAVINTTSVTSYRGHEQLLDYSATKGAITTFTRSLAHMLADRNIRVNAVAPGPIWTPLIPASFDKEKVSKFGTNTTMKRAGQPCEVAPSYVFLASEDASYFTGQVLHPNGGDIMNT
jgi:NAD(P)-dependent dehydrogenase (short-subunit alcohol dehydrogenase family)